MKTTRWIPNITGCCMASSCVLLAGTSWAADPGVAYDKPARTEQVFRADELSIDAFGSVALKEEIIENISRDRVRRNARFGFGAGVNYFFNRYFGVLGGGLHGEHRAFLCGRCRREPGGSHSVRCDTPGAVWVCGRRISI